MIYAKNVILKSLQLPYDASIDEYPEENMELPEKFKESKDAVLEYYREKGKRLKYKKEKFKKEYPEKFEQYLKEMESRKEEKFDSQGRLDDELNYLIKELSIEFTLSDYFLAAFNIYKYNVPYCFKSSDVVSILGISLKEFQTRKNATIRQCQNCGKYFVPKNLNSTKYCNYIFKDNKTCKEVGKDITYKNSLKSDKLLEKYRKRYMSLASNVSRYGIDTAITRFEEYKKEGSIMKENYLNKKITAEEFEKWIEETKSK